MATITTNVPFDNSSLANFKAWAMAISNAFSTFGWVQTTDTGQVNWSTISSVPSGTPVFEVWKANDAQAATMPIFVLVRYGLSPTQPQLTITVGTGSNGAGVITGQIVTGAPWTITAITTNQGSTLFPSYFSGDAGEFRMWMWANPTATPAVGTMFGIERSKDGSGNKTAGYFTVFSASQGTAGFGAGSFQQTISASGVGNRDNGIITPALTNLSATGSAFGTVAALPVFPMLGLVGNPMLGLMSAVATDVAVNSIVTVTSMYGTTHTYIALGGTANSNISASFGLRNAAGTPMTGLLRYE